MEGTAAALYFGAFAGMIKGEDDEALPAFDFKTRTAARRATR